MGRTRSAGTDDRHSVTCALRRNFRLGRDFIIATQKRFYARIYVLKRRINRLGILTFVYHV